jgi:hypothetical protein
MSHALEIRQPDRYICTYLRRRSCNCRPEFPVRKGPPPQDYAGGPCSALHLPACRATPTDGQATVWSGYAGVARSFPVDMGYHMEDETDQRGAQAVHRRWARLLVEDIAVRSSRSKTAIRKATCALRGMGLASRARPTNLRPVVLKNPHPAANASLQKKETC